VESSAINIKFFKGKFNLANANAAMLEVSEEHVSTTNVMIALFLIPVSMFVEVHITKKFFHSTGLGIHLGGIVYTAVDSLSDVLSIHRNGSTIVHAPSRSIRKTMMWEGFTLRFISFASIHPFS
jgi:hypothetical protein